MDIKSLLLSEEEIQRTTYRSAADTPAFTFDSHDYQSPAPRNSDFSSIPPWESRPVQGQNSTVAQPQIPFTYSVVKAESHPSTPPSHVQLFQPHPPFSIQSLLTEDTQGQYWTNHTHRSAFSSLSVPQPSKSAGIFGSRASQIPPSLEFPLNHQLSAISMQRSISADTPIYSHSTPNRLASRLSPGRYRSSSRGSDGAASVSSTTSKRRRGRPKNSGAPASPGARWIGGAPSSGGDSPESAVNYYDDSEEDVSIVSASAGVKAMNLRKSFKSNHDTFRAPRSEGISGILPHPPMPFRIGDRVECIRSDQQGTWYAARVVDIAPQLPDTPLLSSYSTNTTATNLTTDSPTPPMHSANEIAIFVHYEGWPLEDAEWVRQTSVRVCGVAENQPHQFLRYGPSGPEDEGTWRDFGRFFYSAEGKLAREYTGLVFDKRMLAHQCPCHSVKLKHPERPERLTSTLVCLHADGLLRYLKRIQPREATPEELLAVHTGEHIQNYFAPTKVHQNGSRAANVIAGAASVQPNTAPVPISPISARRQYSITSIAALLNHDEDEDEDVHIDVDDEVEEVQRIDQDTDESPSTTPENGELEQVSKTEEKEGRRRVAQLQRMSSGATMLPPSPAPTSPSPEPAAPLIIKPQRNNDTTELWPPTLTSKMQCGHLGIAIDTTFDSLHSPLAARISAGSLINLVDEVARGHIRNGFALIRPPGHHAEDSEAMGFCIYNNVAVAASATLRKYPKLIKRIMIIDWDIHHGNGTQKIFYDNPDVLYISLHRWDHGTFYPFTGAPDECGEGAGLGKNVNIAFSSRERKSMGDTEFIAAFQYIVNPITQQFAPDLIIVSAGFDAAEGHPENLGGYNVTPRGFALMTKMIKTLADELCNGRLVLALEGGYDLQALALSTTATITQLLPPELCGLQQQSFTSSLNAIKPNASAVASLQAVIQCQRSYWHLSDDVCSPAFRFHLPIEWRAQNSISTRPRREKKPKRRPTIEGY